MRYAQIRETDISNGDGLGVALFIQGCNFKCKNCFNPETWDFNGGKEWTIEIEDKFIELASRPYIKRISLLGGECLDDKNLDGILNLVNRIRLLMPEKTIWLYTGYLYEEIDANIDWDNNDNMCWQKRRDILYMCDILVDGRYIDSQRNISLRWRGSKNQRVIDIKKTLKQNEIVLYCN